MSELYLKIAKSKTEKSKAAKPKLVKAITLNSCLKAAKPKLVRAIVFNSCLTYVCSGR